MEFPEGPFSLFGAYEHRSTARPLLLHGRWNAGIARAPAGAGRGAGFGRTSSVLCGFRARAAPLLLDFELGSMPVRESRATTSFSFIFAFR